MAKTSILSNFPIVSPYLLAGSDPLGIAIASKPLSAAYLVQSFNSELIPSIFKWKIF